jgi:hypothetical protein
MRHELPLLGLAVITTAACAQPAVTHLDVAPLFSRPTSVAQYAKAIPWNSTIRPARGQTAGVIARVPVSVPDTRFLRAHVTVVNAPKESDWKLEIEDPSRTEVHTITGRPGDEFWTDEVEGNSLIVKVISMVEDADIELRVDRVTVSLDVPYPQAITTSRRDIEPITRHPDALRAVGRAVVRLRLVSPEGMGHFCTGFMVTAEIMMSNEHCLSNEKVARSALVDFDFEGPHDRPVRARVTEFLLASFPLDYALVRVGPVPSGVMPISLKKRVPPVRNQELLLIQHPNGEHKQVSRINCRLKELQAKGRADGTDFSHLCNTLGGSSGSPILDRRQARLVGLHHLEVQPAGDAPVYNQGVLLDMILRDLEERRRDIHEKVTTE